MCINGEEFKVNYPLRYDADINLHGVLKINSSTTIFPGEKFTYQLPNQFILQKKVAVTERPSAVNWIGGQIVDVKNGCIELVNYTENPVYVKKHQHVADIKNVKQMCVNKINTTSFEEQEDKHFEPFENWDYNENFIQDVKIDPDNTITQEWKNKFLDLCEDLRI